MTDDKNTMEDLVSLCKRRGFVYPASEIYGGINGFWDFGPLGVQLKNNIRDHWWKSMVECTPAGPDGQPLQIVGLDSAIIQNPKTWEASGHVEGFNDPMVDCRECKTRFRVDKIATVTFSKDGDEILSTHIETESASTAFEDAIASLNSKQRKLLKKAGNDVKTSARFLNDTGDGSAVACPLCGGELTEPKMFNLMFETFVGAVRNDDARAYLRPETAQGIFLNYKNVLDTMRVKVPFGVAQIGKAFRNEITPRNFVFRSREFEQMEMEFFCHPDESGRWYEFWKQHRMEWWKSLGISEQNLRFREHGKEELAHYSDACVDIEYRYPFTAPDFGELEGIAHRGCFDLSAHQDYSKIKMEYFDHGGKEADDSRYIPHVIEPASGLTRGTLVLLCEAYTPDPDRPSGVYMKFDPKFAPIKAGILPLVARDGMPEKAVGLYMDLRKDFMVELDIKQNIGKRYARQDEIGTPFCFTIDGQTGEDGTVTVRYRDSLQQERINIDGVKKFLAEKL